MNAFRTGVGAITRFHAHRAPRRDRHHRRPDLALVAVASRPRGGTSVRSAPTISNNSLWRPTTTSRANGSFPGGLLIGVGTRFNPAPAGLPLPRTSASSCGCCRYFEQAPMYNAVNFTSTSADLNLTICGVRVASLICPSDTQKNDRDSPQPGLPQGHARLEL